MELKTRKFCQSFEERFNEFGQVNRFLKPHSGLGVGFELRTPGCCQPGAIHIEPFQGCTILSVAH